MSTPCKQCPCRRNSIPGYLGEKSFEPEEFIYPYLEINLKYVCHKLIDWEKDKLQIREQVDTAKVCSGFATMCKNANKLPKNRDSAEATTMAVKDHINIFSTINEFIQHHKLYEPNEETKKAMHDARSGTNCLDLSLKELNKSKKI